MSKTLQNRGIFTASWTAWLCSFSDTVVDNVASVSLSIYLFIYLFLWVSLKKLVINLRKMALLVLEWVWSGAVLFPTVFFIEP